MKPVVTGSKEWSIKREHAGKRDSNKYGINERTGLIQNLGWCYLGKYEDGNDRGYMNYVQQASAAPILRILGAWGLGSVVLCA